MEFGPDGLLYSMVSSSGSNSLIRSYDPSNGAESNLFSTEFIYGADMEFGPDGLLYSMVSSSGSNSLIRSYDPSNGAESNLFSTEFIYGADMEFSPIPVPNALLLFISGGCLLFYQVRLKRRKIDFS